MKLGLALCGLSVCLGGGYNFMLAASTVVVMDTWKRRKENLTRWCMYGVIFNATV